jgi:hypothetical protein
VLHRRDTDIGHLMFDWLVLVQSSAHELAEMEKSQEQSGGIGECGSFRGPPSTARMK